MISGATYPGVPHWVVITSSVMNLANPKSLILIILPGEVVAYNRFSGLRSLCAIPIEWQYLNASVIARIESEASFSE